MRIKSRDEAARLLLKQLKKYRSENPLVLGIPRGAIPMAKLIAEGLNGELGAIFVHKIPAPGHEEYAIGSVGLSGIINRTSSVDLMHVPDSYIEAEAAKQLKILHERYKRYGLPMQDYSNRVVIIVDDGIATGATVLAAVYEVRVHQPKKIIVASAVAARDSAAEIRKNVDELVLLQEPEAFYSVGQFFEEFPQITDEEVIGLLQTSMKTKSVGVQPLSFG